MYKILLNGVKMIINSMNYTNNPYLHEKSRTSGNLKDKQSVFYERKHESALKTRNKNEVINSGSFTDKSEAATISFNGAKFNKFLSNDKFANFLEYADAHNQTANAFVALITAGMMRPALTMAIPGMKDKKDKIYSATQAISSGFLGFGVTMVLTKPLDDALKKVTKNPEKYNVDFLTNINKKIAELEKAAVSATGEELRNLKQQKKTLDLLVKNIPEWAICVPRAMLTIALIPLILKYVFGLSKTPKNKPAEALQQNNQNDYNNFKGGKHLDKFGVQNPNNAGKVNFNGTPESVVETVVNASKAAGKSGLYDKFTEQIAKHFTAPVLKWKKLQEVADKYKDSDFLFNHVSTVTSAVISGVYMQRTLANDNLEEDKKKVLAVNQGLTFLISTIASYALDNKLESWWQRITAQFIGARSDDKEFANNFKVAQKEVAAKRKELLAKKASKLELEKYKPLKALDYAKSKKLYMPPNIDKYVNGMSLLKKMVIIGSIFRLAVPVLVTPLASVLSEKYLEHKQAAKKA